MFLLLVFFLLCFVFCVALFFVSLCCLFSVFPFLCFSGFFFVLCDSEIVI